MSGLNSSSLEKALEECDIDTLQKAPGVGKKTAQKMILALKGKLTNLNDVSSKGQTSVSCEYEDIVTALTEMGFERKSVIVQVEKIAEEMKAAGSDPLKNEEELFRRSIVALS